MHTALLPRLGTVSLSRRALSGGCLAAALGRFAATTAAWTTAPVFSYPIGLPDRVLGDGFVIRHGFACENVWYNPGWWHTGEDWYLAGGDAAGAVVRAIAAGEIVFVGSDYPGRVVIVRHADDLFSMYGHLDYAPVVEAGTAVDRGALLGTVLARTDGRAPSHLHFEIRTFLTTTEVNGDAPRYAVACGVNCAPGPGYWPISAPEHPVAMGWRNPTHLIHRLAFPSGLSPDDAGADVVVATTAADVIDLWSRPGDLPDAEPRGSLPLIVGDRYRLLDVAAGPEAGEGTSADAYRLWYEIELSADASAWVEAARPSPVDTGADGRPSAVQFDFLPAVLPPEPPMPRATTGD